MAATACGSTSNGDPASGGAGGQGGSGASGGSGGGGACFVPDTACPAERPFVGAACDLSESCTFQDQNLVDTWTYTCVNGRWDGQATCEPTFGGGCPVPPLVESCTDPFSGTTSGATVEVGPATLGTFRPFAENEEAALTWGGQGSPMISFRLRVKGANNVACTRVDTTTTMNGLPASHASAIKLHCGESLTVFTILDVPCDGGTHPFDLAVKLQGIGETTAKLKITDPACPG